MINDMVRTEEQENSAALHIVRDAYKTTIQGSFLDYLFIAFMKADRENFDILRPVVKHLILRYNLKCTCK